MAKASSLSVRYLLTYHHRVLAKLLRSNTLEEFLKTQHFPAFCISNKERNLYSALRKEVTAIINFVKKYEKHHWNKYYPWPALYFLEKIAIVLSSWRLCIPQTRVKILTKCFTLIPTRLYAEEDIEATYNTYAKKACSAWLNHLFSNSAHSQGITLLKIVPNSEIISFQISSMCDMLKGIDFCLEFGVTPTNSFVLFII